MTTSSAVSRAGTGLDAQGYIEREGSLGQVQAEFRPVVAAARDQVLAVFGARLDSAYLYGSVPRGTARSGRSDLDLLIALREERTPTGPTRTPSGRIWTRSSGRSTASAYSWRAGGGC